LLPSPQGGWEKRAASSDVIQSEIVARSGLRENHASSAD
jgi:hypothetical protein